MDHIRKQARVYVSELIKGSDFCGDKIFPSRSRPLARNEMAAAFVYTPNETSEDQTTDGIQQRVITLRVDAVAKGDENLSDDLDDDFATYVETKIAADPQLGGLVSASQYRGMTYVTNTDGEKILHVMSLSFELTVFTRNTDPSTAL